MNKTVDISLEALYNEFNGKLEAGRIERSEHDGIHGYAVYYDLYYNDVLACMDGEEVEVIELNNNVYTLVNRHGESDEIFTLTKNEYDIGVFGG